MFTVLTSFLLIIQLAKMPIVGFEPTFSSVQSLASVSLTIRAMCFLPKCGPAYSFTNIFPLTFLSLKMFRMNEQACPFTFLCIYLPTYLPTHPTTYLPTYLPILLTNSSSSYLPTYLPRYIVNQSKFIVPTYVLTYLPILLTNSSSSYLPRYIVNQFKFIVPTYVLTYLTT